MEAYEVLDLEGEAWTELMAAVEAVPAERRAVDGVVPGWSTHDVLWHVAYWVGRAADVLDRALHGPPYPEEPEDDAYYDEQNAAAVSTGRAMTWDEIAAHLARSRERFRSALETCDSVTCGWISERSMEEIEHYRVHAAQIRAFSDRA